MTLKGMFHIAILLVVPNPLFVATSAWTQSKPQIEAEPASADTMLVEEEVPQTAAVTNDYVPQVNVRETGIGKGKRPDLGNIIAAINLPEPLAGNVEKMLRKKGVHRFVDEGCNVGITVVCFSLGTTLVGPSGNSYYNGSSADGNFRHSGYGAVYGSSSGTLYAKNVVIELVYADGSRIPLANGQGVQEAGWQNGYSVIQDASFGRRGGYNSSSSSIGGNVYVNQAMAVNTAANSAFSKLLGASFWEKINCQTQADWMPNAGQKIDAAFGR